VGSAFGTTGSIGDLGFDYITGPGGTWTLFDIDSYDDNPNPFAGVTLPGGMSVSSVYLDPNFVNDQGRVVGYQLDPVTGADEGPVYWTGTGNTLTSMGIMIDIVAMNDAGQVLGTDSNSGGYIYSIGSGPSGDLPSLVPPVYTGTYGAWNINPITISGTNAQGSFGVLFSGTYQPSNSAPAVTGTFLLTLGGTNWLQQVVIPSNVALTPTPYRSGRRVLNANDLIASPGVITSGSGATISTSALIPVPEDTVQVDTFIPQVWVFDPFDFGVVFSGNDRTTGTSSDFDEFSLEFKMTQTVTVCAFKEPDPDGTQEEATLTKQTGISRAYDMDEAVEDATVDANGNPVEGSGYINPLAQAATLPGTYGFLEQGQASTAGMTVTVTHTTSRIVVAHIVGSAGIPLITLADKLGPITYDFTVTIDKTNPSSPTYTIQGQHGLFPSLEIYVDNTLAYDWDAIVEDTAPVDLEVPALHHQFQVGSNPLPP
jgi:hypothetical protein